MSKKVINYPIRVSVRLSVDHMNKIDSITSSRDYGTSEFFRRILDNIPKTVIEKYI